MYATAKNSPRKEEEVLIAKGFVETKIGQDKKITECKTFESDEVFV